MSWSESAHTLLAERVWNRHCARLGAEIKQWARETLKLSLGASLMVQGLRFQASNAGALGLIPG